MRIDKSNLILEDTGKPMLVKELLLKGGETEMI